MDFCSRNPFLPNIAVRIQNLQGRAFQCRAIVDIDRRNFDRCLFKLDQQSAVLGHAAAGDYLAIFMDGECCIGSKAISIGRDGGTDGIGHTGLQTGDHVDFCSRNPFLPNIAVRIQNLQGRAFQCRAIVGIDRRNADGVGGGLLCDLRVGQHTFARPDGIVDDRAAYIVNHKGRIDGRRRAERLCCALRDGLAAREDDAAVIGHHAVAAAILAGDRAAGGRQTAGARDGDRAVIGHHAVAAAILAGDRVAGGRQTAGARDGDRAVIGHHAVAAAILAGDRVAGSRQTAGIGDNNAAISSQIHAVAAESGLAADRFQIAGAREGDRAAIGLHAVAAESGLTAGSCQTAVAQNGDAAVAENTVGSDRRGCALLGNAVCAFQHQPERILFFVIDGVGTPVIRIPLALVGVVVEG